MDYLRRTLCAVWCCLMLASLVRCLPDGGEGPPLPGPGLSYGGIPYGSMSGNVAEFFSRRAAPSDGFVNYRSDSNAIRPDFTPIEQWLR